MTAVHVDRADLADRTERVDVAQVLARAQRGEISPAQALAVIRKRLGLSRSDLAEEIGYTYDQVYAVEIGRRRASAEFVRQLYRALARRGVDVSPSLLFDAFQPREIRTLRLRVSASLLQSLLDVACRLSDEQLAQVLSIAKALSRDSSRQREVPQTQPPSEDPRQARMVRRL